jgi:hypothetical protein
MVVEIVGGGRVRADERSDAMGQDYVPDVDRPRTQEEQDTLEREEGTKQGLTDPECVGKGCSPNFACRGSYEVGDGLRPGGMMPPLHGL